jgi:hypothetical protein
MEKLDLYLDIAFCSTIIWVKLESSTVMAAMFKSYWDWSDPLHAGLHRVLAAGQLRKVETLTRRFGQAALSSLLHQWQAF